MKPYPEYKDCGIEWSPSIPSHWEVKKLKHLLLKDGLVRGPFGSALKTEFFVEHGYKVYEQKNAIYDDNSLGNSYINAEKFNELKRFSVKEGDYIMSCSGTIGRISLIKKGFQVGVINQALLIIRLNERIAQSFFEHLFRSSGVQYNISDNSQGSAMKNLVGMGIFKNISLPVPPLPEQQAIADFLNCKTAQIDTLIEKKQRQIDLLKEQREALINHAVTKGLNPNAPMKDSGVEWLREIPSHWTMTTARYFFDVKLGKMLDSNKQNEGDWVKPYLRAANIHWNEILLDEVGVNEMGFSETQLERYILQPGDLLVTEGGVTVGRSAIWNGELTECYYQNSLNRARPLKDIKTKWLYYWMYFVTNNGFIDILADKSTFGHLTNEKLKALPIPIPPVSEHNEIIEKLESYEPKMEVQIALIEKQIAYLQEYRTALISEAVTGKIDVR